METEAQRRHHEAYLLGYAHGLRRAAHEVSIAGGPFPLANWLEEAATSAEGERDASIRTATEITEVIPCR